MGLFSRKVPMTVMAAAQIIDGDAEKTRAASRQRREKWQELSFDYYDQLPQVGFAVNFVSDALSRVRLFPAIQPEPDHPPVPLDTADPRYARANEELDKLRSVDGSHAGVLHDLTMQLLLPGDSWLVGYIPKGGNGDTLEYGIFSIYEVQQKDGRWVVFPDPVEYPEGKKLNLPTDKVPTGQPGPQPPFDFLSRLYRPHPKKRTVADSPMRQVVDDCEELILWQLHFQAVVKARISAGLLLWPQEASLPSVNPNDTTGPNRYAKDPVLNDLMTTMITPIQEPGSASAVVPGLVKMKSQFIESVRLLEFARTVDPVAADRMEVLLKNVLTGMPIPNEVVTGLGDLSHWNAWQVGQDSVDSHFKPWLTLECAGLTGGFLRPHMADVPGSEQVLVWFDPSPLITHPNQGTDADNAINIGAIGYEAYRRVKGFTEDDAPTPEDLTLIKELRSSSRTTSDGRGIPSQNAALVASGQRRSVATLGAQLAAIDRDLMARLKVASDGAAFRALERAGAKMRRRVAKDSDLTAAIASVGNDQVCAVLSASVVGQHFATQDELVDDAVSPIMASYLSWTASAQRKVRALLAEYDPQFDAAAVEARQQADRSAGVIALTTGLASAIGFALYDTRATERRGEFDPHSIVQTGMIREVLAVAGGAPANEITDPITGDPRGGVATGVTALDLFAQLEITPAAWVWRYGNSANSFPPHEALDGIEFLDWQDDVLLVPDDFSWMNGTYLFPGDHIGCDCDFEPVMTDNGASSESLSEPG